MWSTVFTTVVLNLDNIFSPVFGSISAVSAVSIKLGSASFFTKSLTADVWSTKLDSPGVQVVQVVDPVAGVAGFLIRAGSIKLIVFFTGAAVVSTNEAVPVAGSAAVQVVQAAPVADGFLTRIVSAKLGFFTGVVPVVPTASVAVPVVLQVVQAVPVDAGSD